MASQPPFSSPNRVRLEFLDGSSTPQVVSAAQPLPVTGGGGGGGGSGGAVTAAAGSYVAGAIVDLGTGASPAANTVNANLVAIKTTLGSPFQAGGSIANTAFGISGALPAGTNTIGNVNQTQATRGFMQLSDGTNAAAIKAASTAALATDPSAVVAFSPNSPLPSGTNSIGAITNSGFGITGALPAGTNTIGKFGIDQTTPGTTNAVQVTTASPGGALANAGFGKVTDGINVAAVKAASTAAAATDPSVVVAVSPNSPVPAVGNRPWSAQVTITRPANTTTYAAGQLLASATTGLTALPTVALGVGANQQVVIQNVAIISSNGAAATKGQFSAYLFNTPSPSGAGFNDASTFAPTAAALAASGNALIGTVASSLPNTGTAAYGYLISNLTFQATTDASGNLYLASVLNNAYPPASGETVTFLFSGVR